uniref:Uncharacterized protein n=1 Tax=Clastoptera arizonana TaxID=38151 RepID=A0A1B6CTV7_9HEMI
MSGDVQPRKRKDKRRKKGQLEAKRSEEYMEESAVFRRQSSATSQDDEDLHHANSKGSEEVIHIQKDQILGGNACAKIIFFCLLGVLGVMVGLIITEYRGSGEVDSTAESPWSLWLEGWIDEGGSHHETEVVTGDLDEDHGEVEPAENEKEVEDEIIPEITRRQTLVEPPEELPTSVPPDEDYEYSDGDEEEENDEVMMRETIDELKAKYQQQTPDDSDMEPTEEDFATKRTDSYDYSPTPPESDQEEEHTESEGEGEEEEEEEEDEDPLGKWRDRGPDLLAEEVEDIQTWSESEDDIQQPPVSTIKRGGPMGINDQDYEKADITNEADLAIKEDLDNAEADFNEGVSLIIG